jgi:hypothetical protein
LESENVKSLIKTSAVYALLIGAVLYLQFYQSLTIPITFENETILLDPTFLFVPLLSLIICSYASSIVKKIIIGKLGPPISSGLKRLGFFSFFWLLTFDPLFPSSFQPIGNFIILFPVIFILRSVILEILRDRNQIVGESIVYTASILLLGYLASTFWQQIQILMEEYHIFTIDTLTGRSTYEVMLGLFYSGLANVLDEAIIISSIFVAALSITKVFRYNENTYLDFIGKRLSTNLSSRFVYFLIFILYVQFLRSFLLDQSGINPQIVTVAEWGIICIISYVIYQRTRKFVDTSMTVPDRIGQWTRHIQEIEHTSDFKLDKLSRLIEKFLYEGDKNELIVYLVDIFRRYNVSVSQINSSLSDLMNHREIELGLISFSWQKKMLENLNLENRLEALDAVMYKLQQTSLQMTFKARRTPLRADDQTYEKQEVTQNEN